MHRGTRRILLSFTWQNNRLRHTCGFPFRVIVNGLVISTPSRRPALSNVSGSSEAFVVVTGLLIFA